MISQEARAARQAYNSQTSADWVPDSFGEDGDYYGALYTFFVDDASWRALLDELDLDVAAYTDPENPRAIGLNTYQDRMPDGTYVSTKPFAGTGAVDLYVTEEREGFSNMGLQEGPDGRPLVGYLDREAGVSGTADIVTAPIDEAATAFRIEIGALCDEEPAVLNAIAANNHFPSIILPETLRREPQGWATTTRTRTRTRSPEPRSRRRITRRLPTSWRRWRATWATSWSTSATSRMRRARTA